MNGVPQQGSVVLEERQEPWLPPALVAPWYEIAAVVAVIIGYSSLASAWQAWHASDRNFIALLLTDNRMVRTIAMECAILGLLFVYLHRRGWRPIDLRIKPTRRSTGIGILLLPAMALANSLTVIAGFSILYFAQSHHERFLAFITSNGPHLKFHSIHVSWLAVVPAVVLNGFFEEITCMAYAFNQFAAKRGPLFALVLIVLLRMSCHTYQGPVHALGIGAAFTVSGLIYWRTRNLWPLILAHIMADMLSFGAIKLLLG